MKKLSRLIDYIIQLLSKEKKWLLPFSLIVLFILAFGIRITNLDVSNYLGERQFRSAIIARSFFFDENDDIPDWRKQVVLASNRNSVVLEPPIFELLVSSIYALINKENIIIARLLSSIFWLTGGIFLYKLNTRIVSEDVAIFGTAYYLLLPLGFVVSVSFLPDSLMIMALLISIYLIVKFYEHPSKRNLLIVTIVSGLAILIKPLVIFMILGAFVSLGVYTKLSPKNLITFIGISLFIGTSYYFYGIFFEKSVAPQAEVSFLPILLLQIDYWKRLIQTATGTVGLIPLVIAIIGLPLTSDGLPRTLLAGLWIGYIIFCLVFTYHIRFAGHYHLQLAVIIALSIGQVFVLIFDRFIHFSDGWYWFLPIVAALLLVMAFSVREMMLKLTSFSNYEIKRISIEIGDIVDHSKQAIHIAPYYGTPLEYYGELSGNYWPRRVSDIDRALGVNRERGVEERLDILGYTPEYFIIADFDEFYTHHDDLNRFLSENCEVLTETDHYLIYGPCSK